MFTLERFPIAPFEVKTENAELSVDKTRSSVGRVSVIKELVMLSVNALGRFAKHSSS